MTSRVKDRNRNREIKDLYFVVQWLSEEPDLVYDAVGARDIVPPGESGVLDLLPGVKCHAMFSGTPYDVKVIATGNYREAKRVQEICERQAQIDSQEGHNDQQSQTKVQASLQGHTKQRTLKKAAKASDQTPTKKTVVSGQNKPPPAKKSPAKKSGCLAPSDQPPPPKKPKLPAPSDQPPPPKKPKLPAQPSPTTKTTKPLCTPKRISKTALTTPAARKISLLSESDSEYGGTEDEGADTPSLEARKKNAFVGLTPGLTSVVTTDIVKLKERVRSLEKSHHKLEAVVSKQAREIKWLRRESSYEMSSASERDRSPFNRSFSWSSPDPLLKVKAPVVSQQDDVIGGVKIDMLRLAAAKLQGDPSSAALRLMDCLFSSEEMVNGNPSGQTKSADVDRVATIQKLDETRMKYLLGMS